jgi:hypothetical protein
MKCLLFQEECEDTKVVIRIRKAKKDRQHNDKGQTTIYKHKHKLGCSRRVDNSCSTSGTRRVNLVANQVISHDG